MTIWKRILLAGTILATCSSAHRRPARYPRLMSRSAIAIAFTLQSNSQTPSR
jgi:hypothetical protein